MAIAGPTLQPRSEIAAIVVLRDIFRHWRLLIATTRIELTKRYAGSALGFAWVFINPILFLSVYLFLYLVVFKMRLPEMSEIGYTVFVFSGLVPYMGFMEAASGSVGLMKANLHFVKNLVFPSSLLPIRMALVALISELVGLAMVIVLSGIDGQLSVQLSLLPLLIVLQFLFFAGIAFLFSVFGMMLPDFGYFLNTFLLFILFITPIGFQPDLVPPRLKPVVILNPFHYMVDAFRSALQESHGVQWVGIGVFAAMSIVIFYLGASCFRRFQAYLVDYE
jgi:lipopolysaccharide transport system permease protein